MTGWLKAIFGIDLLRDTGFTLYSKLGLEIVYFYFQLPLMVLIIAPAIDGLRKDWREASENMGASPRQYWQYVALPILLPSILGARVLLFGNAFGAQATAYQLTSGQIPLVTLLIGAQISGDVLHNPGLGYAMAMGVVVIMGDLDPALLPAAAPIRALAADDRFRCQSVPASTDDDRAASSAEPGAGPRRGPSRRPGHVVDRVHRGNALLLPAARGDPRVLAPARSPDGAAYVNTFNDARFFSSLGYSFLIGLITIVVSMLLIVPTAYWVRLRLPRLRPLVEFVTLMPFVIPPVILVFGLIRSFSSGFLPLAGSQRGSDVLLVAAYTILSLPVHVPRGRHAACGSIDVRSLTEAGQSLGSGTLRILWSVIFPNVRVAILSGAFLTLAIVIGEFTIAVYLARPRVRAVPREAGPEQAPTSRPPCP